MRARDRNPINKQRQVDLNSRGFELEANASLDNGFSVIASYTYLRVKIERGAKDHLLGSLFASLRYRFG